jgi:hypothetical protein
MIDWAVNRIFSIKSLREAVSEEVHLYDYLGRIMQDPESMKTAISMWDEGDGWRGWAIKENGNYYFNDIPEKSLMDLMDILQERESE